MTVRCPAGDTQTLGTARLWIIHFRIPQCMHLMYIPYFSWLIIAVTALIRAFHFSWIISKRALSYYLKTLRNVVKSFIKSNVIITIKYLCLAVSFCVFFLSLLCVVCLHTKQHATAGELLRHKKKTLMRKPSPKQPVTSSLRDDDMGHLCKPEMKWRWKETFCTWEKNVEWVKKKSNREGRDREERRE